MTSQNLDIYADQIYIEDRTGEEFIENIINTTFLNDVVVNRLLHNQGQFPVLEMGLGHGVNIDILLQNKLNVEVVEGSSALCDFGMRKFKDLIKIHCQYFESFNPSEKYRTVLSLHVLEHVDDPVKVARKIHEWLEPGGQVIAVVPNAHSLHRQLAVMMGLQSEEASLSERDKTVGHQRVMCLDELISVFQSTGFKVKETFGYFLKTVPNSMMCDYSSDLIKALTKMSYGMDPREMANIGLIATKS